MFCQRTCRLVLFTPPLVSSLMVEPSGRTGGPRAAPFCEIRVREPSSQRGHRLETRLLSLLRDEWPAARYSVSDGISLQPQDLGPGCQSSRIAYRARPLSTCCQSDSQHYVGSGTGGILRWGVLGAALDEVGYAPRACRAPLHGQSAWPWLCGTPRSQTPGVRPFRP